MRVSITRSSALRQSLALVVTLSACADAPTAPTKSPLTPLADREVRVSCDPDNGGITLPRGFCAVVVADIVIDGAPADDQLNAGRGHSLDQHALKFQIGAVAGDVGVKLRPAVRELFGVVEV